MQPVGVLIFVDQDMIKEAADLRRQVREMIRTKRAPAWMMDYILFTDDPAEVVAFYRKKLQVL